MLNKCVHPTCRSVPGACRGLQSLNFHAALFSVGKLPFKLTGLERIENPEAYQRFVPISRYPRGLFVVG